MTTAEEWIEKGYEHFAMVGPINFSVKKISEQNNISRTTFNYHFASQEDFFAELLVTHEQILGKVLVDAKTAVKHYVPDILVLANQYSIFIRFQLQLFNHRFNPEFDRVYKLCVRLTSEEFSTNRFIDYYELKITKKQATDIHEILIDAWFSRLNEDDITLEAMMRNTESIMESLRPWMK